MRGYVDTRWGQLHYSSKGDGPATLVCFHETPLNAHAWDRLAAALPDSVRLIAFDTPGYGESDPPPAITTIEEYIDTMADGIDALSVDRLTVCGVHTGASLALQAAVSRLAPRVDGIVIIGLPLYSEEVRRAKVPAVVPDFKDDGSHLLASFHRPPKEYDNQLLSLMTGAVCELPDRAFWAYHSVYAYDPAAVLPHVKAPALILSNPMDPLFNGDNEALATLADARQVLVESDTLPLYWTQPAVVAREITAFMKARQQALTQ